MFNIHILRKSIRINSIGLLSSSQLSKHNIQHILLYKVSLEVCWAAAAHTDRHRPNHIKLVIVSETVSRSQNVQIPPARIPLSSVETTDALFLIQLVWIFSVGYPKQHCNMEQVCVPRTRTHVCVCVCALSRSRFCACMRVCPNKTTSLAG